MSIDDGFHVFSMDDDNATKRFDFESLYRSVDFEKVANGRWGANIARFDHSDDDDDDHATVIPLVRTTTVYQNGAQPMKGIHQDLIEAIRATVAAASSKGIINDPAAPPRTNNVDAQVVQFNHAMVEVYDETYRKMGFHTDQALDLKDESYICIYSCYETITEGSSGSSTSTSASSATTTTTGGRGTRTLVVQPKHPGPDKPPPCAIEMKDKSFVLFSTDTNRRFVHKIVLDDDHRRGGSAKGRWLGFTFRLSKTCVVHDTAAQPTLLTTTTTIGGGDHRRCRRGHRESSSSPSTAAATPLRLASDAERKAFFRLKGQENREVVDVWAAAGSVSPIDYTLCASDLTLTARY
jgi:hypothetical protein